MKTWCISDAAGALLSNMNESFDMLPSPLPWIEPSINCLHLESALSLMVGNAECCILSTCALLEHTLRLALINKDECGLHRPESIAQIDKYQSLSAIVSVASGTDIFKKCDEKWWRAVATQIRNKSAHYLLPTIMKNCANDPNLKHYINVYEFPENNSDWYYNKYITDWGSFYHRAGWSIAAHLLKDATEQLKIVIGNTNWSGDESWWESQKWHYDSFFSYDWNVENVKKSFENTYSEHHKKQNEKT